MTVIIVEEIHLKEKLVISCVQHVHHLLLAPHRPFLARTECIRTDLSAAFVLPILFVIKLRLSAWRDLDTIPVTTLVELVRLDNGNRKWAI